MLLPRFAVDERLHVFVGAPAVALESVVFFQFGVVYDRLDEVIGEVATLQLVYLCKQESLHVVESLSFPRCSCEDVHRVVHEVL